MLRQIVPLFEHKIFLTATPHNGNTLSFSGLLEMLDPARFRRTDVLTPSEKERVQQVVIRRLKREINTRTNPPKFCTRMEPEALSLDDDFLASAVELQLIFAVEDFKHAVHTAIASASKTKQLAGCFAIEVLGKRLLSCPMTFIESWKRCKASLDSAETVDDAEINQLKRSLDEEITDDKEAQQWNNAAASKVGAWLRTFTESLSNEIREIDKSIQKLGIDISKDLVEQKPKSDARFAQLVRLIEEKLKNDKEWKSDERLVIFTEYKTTQDYLLRRLTEHFNDKEHSRILILYGGMDDVEREVVKSRFNDEGDPVRILLATDAASEGLNLQETARYLLHFDCPWNPSRLEQRNGRLDRHGQARDVYIFHFTSTTASDLQFLSTMIKKVNTGNCN
jgi:SNF2 family DNA or RNA helicase